MSNEADRALDEYLLLLARQGSRPAFDRLARRWTPRLLRYAARKTGSADLARDVVQETWLGVVQGLRRHDGVNSFAAWVYSIAHRRCVDSIRRAGRYRRLADALRAEETSAAHVEHGQNENGENAQLASVLPRLSDEHRDVLTLFYQEELGVQEMATVLGVPAGTVKSRLHHARQTFKTLLGESDEKHR